MLYSSLYFLDSGKSLEEKIVNDYKKPNMKNYFIQLLRKYIEAERKLMQVIWLICWGFSEESYFMTIFLLTKHPYHNIWNHYLFNEPEVTSAVS